MDSALKLLVAMALLASNNPKVMPFFPAQARLEFTWRYQERATTSFDR